MHFIISSTDLYEIDDSLDLGALYFGLKNGLIAVKDLRAYISQTLDEKSENGVYDLIVEDDDFNFIAKLKELIPNYNETLGKKCWIYIFLKYLSKYEAMVDDPYQEIESFSANINYPQILSPLIRYMPLPEGSIGGIDEMKKNWLKLIDELKDKDFNLTRI